MTTYHIESSTVDWRDFTKPIKKFTEDQPRDDHGRWTSDGSDEDKLKDMFSEGLGFARKDMPQIPHGPMKTKFLEEERARGIKVSEVTAVPARDLKPTQNEYNLDNVNYIREELKNGTAITNNPIIISEDNRVLDGHHRWAAEALNGGKVDAIRVGLPIAALMSDAQAFNERNNITRHSKDDADARASKKLDLLDELEKMETYTGLVKYDDDEERDDHGRWTSGGNSSAADKQAAKEVVVYHGTSSDVLAEIKKEGLIPGHGGGGDAWAAKHGKSGVAEAFIKERPASVYFTPDKSMAQQFARMVIQEHPNAKPVLLEIHLPSIALSRIRQDEKAPGAYRMEAAIKPEWITKATVIRGKGGAVAGLSPSAALDESALPHRIGKSAPQVIYAIIATDA